MRRVGYDIRTKQGRVRQCVLTEVVRRVVEAANPDQIILFGSAARGEMEPHSDLDLLIIKGGKFNRERLTRDVYRTLQGVRAAVDVVIVTSEEVDRYRNTHCLVICPALREGKVVYGAKASASRRST
jgi:predicted nucleotidyltransferase